MKRGHVAACHDFSLINSNFSVISFAVCFQIVTIIHKIFETNSSFHAEKCTTGKV